MEKEHQASLRYTIAQLCEQMESQANVSFDKFYVSALTQIAYDFILTCFGPDLFYAAQFRNGQLNSISPPSSSTGKKKKSSAVTAVEAQDVLFQSRRNQVLNDHLVQILTHLLKDHHRHKKTKKGQFNQKRTHRHHHHEENEDYKEEEDDNLEAYDEFSVTDDEDDDEEEQVQQEHIHVNNDENDDYCDIDLRSVVVNRNRDRHKISKKSQTNRQEHLNESGASVVVSSNIASMNKRKRSRQILDDDDESNNNNESNEDSNAQNKNSNHRTRTTTENRSRGEASKQTKVATTSSKVGLKIRKQRVMPSGSDEDAYDDLK